MAKRKRLSHPALQSTSSKGKHDARGETYLMMARDKLKGALEDLLDSDSSSSSDDEASQSASPSKQISAKKEQKPPVIRRRKRKLALDLDLAFQHTFVMKLFDRSVDLAQFQEDTPLYPICRAWIANQPRVPLPYPPLEYPDIKKEEENTFELESDEGKDFCNLPPPSSPPWNNRIPPVSATALQGITFDYSSENLPTADQLLKEHVARWGNVRKQWIEAAQTNETRFKNSGQILANMYKRAQSAFNL